MNILQFERELAGLRLERYRHPQLDIIQDGFRPVSGQVADFCCIEHKGSHHFFYIERRLIEGTPFYPGNEIYFGHASTADFFRWEVHEPTILIVPGTWEGSHLWAPNVVPYCGGFLMAYTGVNSFLSQDIGLAYSDDLFHWERFDTNPISPCKGRDWSFWREDDIASCRDPHLLFEGGRLFMAYTANTARGEACIALASSEDLIRWEDHGPLIRGPSEGYEPDIGGGHKQGSLESPNLFSYGGKWYLQFMFRMNGCEIINWIAESDTMFGFSWESTREFWPGAYTVEVVKRRGSRMLLACAGPIRFGLAELGGPFPAAHFIRTREELEAWNE